MRIQLASSTRWAKLQRAYETNGERAPLSQNTDMETPMTHRKTAAITCGFALAALGIAFDAAADSPTKSAPPSNADSCLAFTMPDPSLLFGSPKKVFAHYFYPFPLSVGNKAASDDYYNANYSKSQRRSRQMAVAGWIFAPAMAIACGGGLRSQLAAVQHPAGDPARHGARHHRLHHRRYVR